jgi:hypothetical protein
LTLIYKSKESNLLERISTIGRLYDEMGEEYIFYVINHNKVKHQGGHNMYMMMLKSKGIPILISLFSQYVCYM